MPEYNFQFRGWQALAAIAALLGYFGLQIYLRIRPVDDAMRDAIRVQLLKDYSGLSRNDIARIIAKAHEGQPLGHIPEIAQHDIQFTSASAHGRIGGPVTFVKVELTVDGGPPPDGESVRYFTLSHELDGSWLVVGEHDSYRYRRELFP
ncbi:MAG TPA: hypothetical protein VJX70_06960 [Candidatus Acidoferrum sp.]|nr:hypothetical protein [Candidatus Acidoferrum sp.]